MGGMLCAMVPAFAGAAPTEPIYPPALLAQIQPLDRFEAEQERLRQAMSNQPAAYVDRVMKEGSEGSEAGPAGLPEAPAMGLRSWLLEGRLGWNGQRQSGQDARRDAEGGVRLEHRFETLNHGEWVLQADTRRQDDSGVGSPSSFFLPTEEKRGNRLTLRNQGFPVTPFVFADSAVGDISSEVTDGLSRGLRLSLGSSTVRGASVRLFAREFDVRIGLGQRGQLAGGPYPGFERAQGDLAWAGYTHRWGPLNYAAVQASHATQVPWSGTSGDPSLSVARTASWAATVGHGYSLNSDGDRRVRLTLLKSETVPTSGGERSPSQGLYLEGGLRTGRLRQEAGLYSTQPRLRFGDQWVADGARGVFWRMDQNDNRLNWGVGLDHERQPASGTTGSAFTRSGINTNWQYRIDRNSSWGGYVQHSRQRSATLAGAARGQRSSYGSVSYQERWRDWGDSRLRLTVRRNQALVSNAVSATGEELEWEQDWLRQQPGGMQADVLRTTLGWARDRRAGDAQTYPTAGLTWQTWLSPDWNLSTSLRYTSRTGNLATSRGLSGALQTEKRLAPGWTIGASVLLNQAVVTVDPGALLPGSATVSRSNDRSALLFVRYELQQGQAYGFGLRGEQGAGTGRISGVVFFDANRDGIQQADEAGVPGVEVFLNQRSRVITDERGRYSFTLVPTGTQRLSLRPESVPLPWGEGPQSQASVDVPLRGEATAPLAVVKSTE
ncbi:MAG: SdrD B-like domain-containing protein [Hydrogenophaga sp.]|nr:SdrD B-like domain-containing protein [Hydrogenophaga sp.]